MRQGGYLLRWADSTNQYHAAQADERESPGSGKVRKNFEKDPRASWQGRTTQCSTLLQAGEAAPKWQLMPHTTQFPCWMRAAIGESLAQVPGLAVGRGGRSPIWPLHHILAYRPWIPVGGRGYICTGATMALVPGNSGWRSCIPP